VSEPGLGVGLPVGITFVMAKVASVSEADFAWLMISVVDDKVVPAVFSHAASMRTRREKSMDMVLSHAGRM
jgi:hypothetical protein